LANASNQRLATLDFPSGLILSRVRCIALFCPRLTTLYRMVGNLWPHPKT
jgi:hypothetical protein